MLYNYVKSFQLVFLVINFCICIVACVAELGKLNLIAIASIECLVQVKFVFTSMILVI